MLFSVRLNTRVDIAISVCLSVHVKIYHKCRVLNCTVVQEKRWVVDKPVHYAKKGDFFRHSYNFQIPKLKKKTFLKLHDILGYSKNIFINWKVDEIDVVICCNLVFAILLLLQTRMGKNNHDMFHKMQYFKKIINNNMRLT